MSIEKSASGERLSFTVFVAIVLHIIIIVGIGFSWTLNQKAAPTLNITLATHQSLKAPEKADFLAQFDQEASGSGEKTQELTTNQHSEVVSPRVNDITPVPQQKTTMASQSSDEFITTDSSQVKIQKPETSKDNESNEEKIAQMDDAPLDYPEIASLQAKLHKIEQDIARRPRIRRMTSVATKSSHDAAYLNKWTQRVEIMGNQNFPQAALEQKMFGSLRLSVIVNADGSVEEVEVLKPSGFPILDQAALQIVRLSSPFDPFPHEIAENTDQLDIIRTWRFEITGLKTASN